MKVVCIKQHPWVHVFHIGCVYSASFIDKKDLPSHKIKIYHSTEPPIEVLFTLGDFFEHFKFLGEDMPKSEAELRKDQIKVALIRAFEAVSSENWFEALSSIQEAEIITRACKDDQHESDMHQSL